MVSPPLPMLMVELPPFAAMASLPPDMLIALAVAEPPLPAMASPAAMVNVPVMSKAVEQVKSAAGGGCGRVDGNVGNRLRLTNPQEPGIDGDAAPVGDLVCAAPTQFPAAGE